MRRHLLRASFVPGALMLALSSPSLAQDQPATRAALDYQVFRDKVQPILLARRPGHARCVSCHTQGQGVLGADTRMPLQPLTKGATGWDEEQSRRNFAAVSQKVVAGSVRQSRLLVHLLRTEAGGDSGHGGGKHWMSPADPEFQTLAAWVLGRTSDNDRPRQ